MAEASPTVGGTVGDGRRATGDGRRATDGARTPSSRLTAQNSQLPFAPYALFLSLSRYAFLTFATLGAITIWQYG